MLLVGKKNGKKNFYQVKIFLAVRRNLWVYPSYLL